MAEKLFDDSKYHKLGIMGGTFNPIHVGHLLLAEAALTEVNLDGVMFLPSGQSYMKEEDRIVDAKYRLEMTHLAICDHPSFFVSDIEIKRRGNTYTCDTLSQIKQLHPKTELYFIMGADCLFSIENWKNPEQIFEACTILTTVRDEADYAQLNEQAQKLKDKFQAKIIILPFLKTEISSTTIRERIAQKKSIRYMVPKAVYAYIEENKLYQ